MVPAIVSGEIFADTGSLDVVFALLTGDLACLVNYFADALASPPIVFRFEPDPNPDLDPEPASPPHPCDRGPDRDDSTPKLVLIGQMRIPSPEHRFRAGASGIFVLVQARNSDLGVDKGRPLRSKRQQHFCSDLRSPQAVLHLTGVASREAVCLDLGLPLLRNRERRRNWQ